MTVVCCWKRCCLIGVWISMIDRRRWRRWYDDAVGARSRWFMVRERETMWCGRSLTMLLMCTGIVRWTRAIERITLVQSSIFTSICVIPRSTTRVGAALIIRCVCSSCMCMCVCSGYEQWWFSANGRLFTRSQRKNNNNACCLLSFNVRLCMCVCV